MKRSPDARPAAPSPSGPAPAVAWATVGVVFVVTTVVVATTAPGATLAGGAVLAALLVVVIVIAWSVGEAWRGAGVQTGDWHEPSDWTPDDEANHRRREAEAAGPVHYRAARRAQVPLAALMAGAWMLAALTAYDAGGTIFWTIALAWIAVSSVLLVTVGLFSWPRPLLVASARQRSRDAVR